MVCPSCFSKNDDEARFCGRCRMRLSRAHLAYAKFLDHFSWILRRANAGFLSGVIAWFFIPALSRVIASESIPVLHFFITGMLGGAFLGTIDGMIEESTPKTVRGAMIGGIGGALGGIIFGSIQGGLGPEKITWGIFLFWAITGSFIGSISAVWERRLKKILAGVFSGFIGGGIGGALGYSMYTFLIQNYDPGHWLFRRLYEGFSGGIIGLSLWFSIGVAERFIIFKRKLIEESNHKHCEFCETKNPLVAWYCGKCGGVLQVQAPPERLNLSPFTTLDRLRNLFKFLTRLSASTGFIAGVVVFIVFVPYNPFLAAVALVLVAAISYSFLIIFSALSESLQIFMKK